MNYDRLSTGIPSATLRLLRRTREHGVHELIEKKVLSNDHCEV